MKFFKLLFSKALIIFLLLVIQFIFIYVSIAILEAFPLFQLINIIISLSVFFTFVNKKECPEFKIPWLVLLSILPFFTIMFYIIFANPKTSKKDYARLQKIQEQTDKFTQKTDNDLTKTLRDNVGIERYLKTNADLGGHLGNKVTYFKLGEEFWSDLLVELEKAKKYIFMEYFIIKQGKMWDSIHEILQRKVKDGVEVRLMYDDIGTFGMLKSNFYKTLRKEGINCYKFNKFKPIISGVYNNRDHRKITIIDGKVAYTGGINIGDEYVNVDKKLGHWKDTAIKIEGSAVDNLLALYLQLFDMNAKKTPVDYSKYFVTGHEKFDERGCVQPFGDGPKPLYSEQVGENNYINLINSAKKYCYITTPYLILDYNLTTALRNAAFRGVDVRIVTPFIPDKKIIQTMTRSNYSYLMKAGVKIFEYSPGFVHAKMLVVDDELAFVGTINLDYRSLVHHYECGAVLYNTPCIKDIKLDFDDIFKVCQEKTLSNFKMGKFASLVNAVLNVFSPML